MDAASRVWSTVSSVIHRNTVYSSWLHFPSAPRFSSFLPSPHMNIALLPRHSRAVYFLVKGLRYLGLRGCLRVCAFAWWDGLFAGSLRRREFEGQGGDLREQDAGRHKMNQIVDSRRQGESEVRGALLWWREGDERLLGTAPILKPLRNNSLQQVALFIQLPLLSL